MIVFLKGYTSGTEYSGGCTFEEAMDISFGKNLSSFDHVHAGRSGTGYWSETGNSCLGAANSDLLKICSIVGLIWIGKGLLMRRARDINRHAKDGGLKIWQN
ncbi:hypothetical protein NC653_038196 [Populus alba x Populus x berolinensis]|uniref:Uncharacterized protein n=1 Tax=Populus alba x Populus x berolinensis TaxID=444605 RepID=A0AAD6LGF3_9ROSI|nr:hypothetical protein NC653_038196 [Populus alba x Populus x berolinensis]